jgi:leader peptidase (prepilin peptidase)/N-methyltransferase
MITDILAGFIGWVVGVLVNYVADVLPLRRRLVRPFCFACDQPQGWVSYAVWPRKCSHCGQRRSWRAWLVVIIYIILAIWLWEMPAEKLGFLGGLLLLAYFGVVVIIDIEYRLIMHPVSIFGAILALVIGVYLHGWPNTLLGGLAGFGAMWLLYKLGELMMILISKIRGQSIGDVALGFGDVNLSGVLGLLLGWPAIFVGLLLAVLLAGIVSFFYLILMLALRRYRLFTALPYGPFLVAGAGLLIFFREALIKFLEK